jgi:hypothetical protein
MLSLGLVGGSITVVPRPLTQAAGVIAIVSAVLVTPSWLLYGLLHEPDAKDRSVSLLAIRWWWRIAISGGILTAVGVILLLPGTRATVEIRIAGTIALIYGVLCDLISVLSFRKKRLLRRSPRSEQC